MSISVWHFLEPTETLWDLKQSFPLLPPPPKQRNSVDPQLLLLFSSGFVLLHLGNGSFSHAMLFFSLWITLSLTFNSSYNIGFSHIATSEKLRKLWRKSNDFIIGEDEVYVKDGCKRTRREVQSIVKTRTAPTLFFCVSSFEQFRLSFKKKKVSWRKVWNSI